MRRLIALLPLVVSNVAWSQESSDFLAPSPCVTGTQLAAHTLPDKYQQGIFTLYYTTVGDDALSDPSRRSSHAPPLRILDIARQLQAAQQFYVKDLQLRTPLSQPIFQRAQQISVFILNLKGNGSAFDKVAHETFANGEQTPCGLKIMLSNRLDPKNNPTPAHELFHLYQYGYALFKQRWYLEGMAKWMETVFKPDEPVSMAMTAPVNCSAWYSQSYNAAILWQGLAQHYPNIPVTTGKITYSNRQPVFKKTLFSGGAMANSLLTALSQQSLRLTQHYHRPMRNWSEKQQHQSQDNDTICRVLNQLLVKR
ncbi:peptidase [Rosenbergiella collisarenosi]|uniref:peptidase n=1 Tax=Rosenbergiella collisarenosi TaxID=1544695 RepID=UPI001F4F66DE|nr:peptidase [Rosenbergiella collisarenosi]